jgi:nucleoside-diphosphate-sugar epimerase
MAQKVSIKDPAIASGSTILVTGANGLIGSHCVDQFLSAGFKVRGTVRSIDRCRWMVDLFCKRYSDGQFELVEVKDFSVPGCFDEVVKGVAGIAHTASHVDAKVSEPEPTIPLCIKTVLTALESAKKEPTVKRFVLTSSAWAAAAPCPDVGFSIDENTWNEEAVRAAWAKDPPPNGLQIVMAGKTQAEQEAWKWVKTHQPHFIFSSVLPDTCFGAVLEPNRQGIPSSAGMLRMLFEGQNLEYLKFVQPQWFIDVVDTAKLHVAALIEPSVKGERILGYAEPFNWNDLLAIFRRMFPGKQFIDDMHLGKDVSRVSNERGGELLRKLYGHGWTSLEDSAVANIISFEDGEEISENVRWQS